MASTFSRFKNMAPKRGPYVEIPQRAKLQNFRRHTGVVIPRPLLDYYGINEDNAELEFSIAEGGYYMRIVRKGDFSC